MNGVVENCRTQQISDANLTAKSDKEKADRARNFAAVSQDGNFPGLFRLKKQETATSLGEKLRDIKATFDHGEALNASFSLHELKRAIRESKEKSASGEDNIPYAKIPTKKVDSCFA